MLKVPVEARALLTKYSHLTSLHQLEQGQSINDPAPYACQDDSSTADTVHRTSGFFGKSPCADHLS